VECEIRLQKDGSGWRFSAKGALGVTVANYRSATSASHITNKKTIHNHYEWCQSIFAQNAKKGVRELL
jgi:hypothetical protein